MNNLDNNHSVENLVNDGDLYKYNYLVYGGYVKPALIKEINVSIRKFLRSAIKCSKNNLFKSELRAINKRLIKEVGVLEHLKEIHDLLEKKADFNKQSITSLIVLLKTISIKLLPSMSDPRVQNAIEKKLPL